MLRSVIEGVGSALPKRIMTNADISKIVDTTDEWIVERTGMGASYRGEMKPRAHPCGAGRAQALDMPG